MRRVSIILAAIFVAGAATTQAQTPASAADKKMYAAVATGITTGHAAGAIVGADVGVRLNEAWDVFIEGGRMVNTVSADTEAAAQVVAKFIGTSTTFTAKQPVNFGTVGLRYKFPVSGRIQPYLGAGVGVAKVTRNVNFAINGNDITPQLLDPYGVALGTDLSGSENKALVTIGAGVQVPIAGPWFAGLSYRFARIFLTDSSLSTSRAQFGVGVRF